eukprot:TRINITY_DN10016_c0_g1_i1.p1 TRINITY_DN10016_c0_g1~~TRINITY_DN10016_c0_g1_i1.p1  ORF type:complete len:263 (-),score=89.32 TRINITY_DN10016_c0_g1_i1:27-815(-)
MSRYDRAITVFSPDGHLFQVEYAMNAVKRGTTVVGIKGENVVVLGVEKKATPKLQDTRTLRKIVQIDDHIFLAFAGLSADARVLINRARVECQSYRLTFDERPSVMYITKWIASKQQSYTQSGGVRPYGITTFIVGFEDGEPKLYETDPAGTYSEWVANSCGRHGEPVKKFLVQKYPGVKEDEDDKDESSSETDEEEEDVEPLDEDGAVKLAVQALLDVVESPKNIEIAIVHQEQPLLYLEQEEIEAIVTQIEAEQAAEKEQ